MSYDDEHQRDLERLARLRPIDDDFMRCLFNEDLALAQEVLRILTGIDDLVLTEQRTQYDMKRLVGARSLCLDVWGRDSQGRLYDLEIQRGDDANPKRLRYHSTIMDLDVLDKGNDLASLPEAYVIFVMEHDPFGMGAGTYHFRRYDTDLGLSLEDGTHLIYANGDYRGGDDLGILMHDFAQCNPSSMKNPLLCERAGYLKRSQKGVSQMCEMLEQMRDEAREQGIKQGIEQGIKQGVEQGIKQGVEQGIKQGVEQGIKQGVEQSTAEYIARVMEQLKVSAQAAMDVLGVPAAERSYYLAML